MGLLDQVRFVRTEQHRLLNIHPVEVQGGRFVGIQGVRENVFEDALLMLEQRLVPLFKVIGVRLEREVSNDVKRNVLVPRR